MSIISRIIDTLANEDVIDLYFIQSDMNPDLDIRDDPREFTLHGQYDSMASQTNMPDDDPRPLGKRVY